MCLTSSIFIVQVKLFALHRLHSSSCSPLGNILYEKINPFSYSPFNWGMTPRSPVNNSLSALWASYSNNPREKSSLRERLFVWRSRRSGSFLKRPAAKWNGTKSHEISVCLSVTLDLEMSSVSHQCWWNDKDRAVEWKKLVKTLITEGQVGISNVWLTGKLLILLTFILW